MNWINALLDGIVTFIKRNPLFCLMVVMLALMAPSVLKGLAAFALYFLIGILLFGVVLVLLLRWRLKSAQRSMEEQFRQAGRTPGTPPGGSQNTPQEGEVKVYRTAETPEKRIKEDVGDYVEFEETKNK